MLWMTNDLAVLAKRGDVDVWSCIRSAGEKGVHFGKGPGRFPGNKTDIHIYIHIFPPPQNASRACEWIPTIALWLCVVNGHSQRLFTGLIDRLEHG